MAFFKALFGPRETEKEMYERACEFGRQKRYDLAYDIFYELAEEGNVYAAANLANYYRFGKGVPKDENQVFYWLQQAASTFEIPRGVGFDLAECYATGFGTKQNTIEAIKWYEREIEHPHPKELERCMYRAGCLRQEVGNEVKAFYWFSEFSKIAKKDTRYRDGFVRLAECYEKGRGTAKNISLAIQWYQYYLDIKKSPKIILRVARLMDKKGSRKEAIALLQPLAKTGHEEAQELLKELTAVHEDISGDEYNPDLVAFKARITSTISIQPDILEQVDRTIAARDAAYQKKEKEKRDAEQKKLNPEQAKKESEAAAEEEEREMAKLKEKVSKQLAATQPMPKITRSKLPTFLTGELPKCPPAFTNMNVQQAATISEAEAAIVLETEVANMLESSTGAKKSTLDVEFVRNPETEDGKELDLASEPVEEAEPQEFSAGSEAATEEPGVEEESGEESASEASAEPGVGEESSGEESAIEASAEPGVEEESSGEESAIEASAEPGVGEESAGEESASDAFEEPEPQEFAVGSESKSVAEELEVEEESVGEPGVEEESVEEPGVEEFAAAPEPESAAIMSVASETEPVTGGMTVPEFAAASEAATEPEAETASKTATVPETASEATTESETAVVTEPVTEAASIMAAAPAPEPEPEPVIQDTVYEGEVKDGVPNGFGRITHFIDEYNISVYEGQIVQGMPHGTGKFWLEDGAGNILQLYEGDFEYGDMTGSGQYAYVNGDIYAGAFHKGTLLGQGKLRLNSGTTYEGNFFMGKPNGYGTIYSIYGIVYEGYYTNGHMNGIGRITYPDGTVYSGEVTGGEIPADPLLVYLRLQDGQEYQFTL